MMENCVFCGTYYSGMLYRLGHSVCHDCWKEVIELVKKELSH